MTNLVLDASAGVEMVARTVVGVQLGQLVPAGTTFWVPDGLYDVELLAVLRRWDLNSILTPTQVTSTRMRLAALRLRRVAVGALAERAWQLRANITFPDACYVALAETLQCSVLTADLKLVAVPKRPDPEQ